MQLQRANVFLQVAQFEQMIEVVTVRSLQRQCIVAAVSELQHLVRAGRSQPLLPSLIVDRIWRRGHHHVIGPVCGLPARIRRKDSAYAGGNLGQFAVMPQTDMYCTEKRQQGLRKFAETDNQQPFTAPRPQQLADQRAVGCATQSLQVLLANRLRVIQQMFNDRCEWRDAFCCRARPECLPGLPELAADIGFSRHPAVQAGYHFKQQPVGVDAAM